MVIDMMMVNNQINGKNKNKKKCNVKSINIVVYKLNKKIY